MKSGALRCSDCSSVSGVLAVSVVDAAVVVDSTLSGFSTFFVLSLSSFDSFFDDDDDDDEDDDLSEGFLDFFFFEAKCLKLACSTPILLCRGKNLIRVTVVAIARSSILLLLLLLLVCCKPLDFRSKFDNNDDEGDDNDNDDDNERELVLNRFVVEMNRAQARYLVNTICCLILLFTNKVFI